MPRKSPHSPFPHFELLCLFIIIYQFTLVVEFLVPTVVSVMAEPKRVGVLFPAIGKLKKML